MTTKKEYDDAAALGAARDAEKEGAPVTAAIIQAACQAVAKANNSDLDANGRHKDYWVSRQIIRAAIEAAFAHPDAAAALAAIASAEHVTRKDCWCGPKESSPGVWLHKEKKDQN